MKLSALLELAQSSMDRWGDIDCFLHSDVDAEHFVMIEDVIGEYVGEDEPILVLTTYEVKPRLTLVT